MWNIYIYIFLTLGVKLYIHLLNVVVQFIVFLTLSTLLCRGTDISKCLSESFGIRDNGGQLYLYRHTFYLQLYKPSWQFQNIIVYGKLSICWSLNKLTQIYVVKSFQEVQL